MRQKVRYVLEKIKTEKDHRHHTCHWPNCTEQVHPAQWGCQRHWYKLPKDLRNKLWSVYRPGQEATLSPSRRYVEVANEIQEWIKAQKKLHSHKPR